MTLAAGVVVILALISAACYVTNICNVRKDLFPLSVYLLVISGVLRSEGRIHDGWIPDSFACGVWWFHLFAWHCVGVEVKLLS